jgi:hypothetical protein
VVQEQAVPETAFPAAEDTEDAEINEVEKRIRGIPVQMIGLEIYEQALSVHPESVVRCRIGTSSSLVIICQLTTFGPEL